jgi:protease I
MEKNFRQKKILMLVGDYVEDYEAMVPIQCLEMVGHEVHAVCPGKKKGDTVKTAIHDFEGDQTYSEKPGHNFKLTYDFSSVKVEDYDGLLISGGRAPEYLRLNKDVIDIAKHFIVKMKPLAAICHGIQILTATKEIQHRQLTCYEAVSIEVELCGAVYKKVEVDDIVVDNNIVTCPAWPGHPKWLRKFLELLGTSFVSI